MRLLLIEDENEIADFVVRGLREEGILVERIAHGADGWAALQRDEWDVVLLDWWLPGVDGLTLLRRLRQSGRQTPVLMLTARDAVSDRVQGLDGGADDYLCKPFAFSELLARVRALSRRQPVSGDTVLGDGDIVADPLAHRFERAGRLLDLTGKEQALVGHGVCRRALRPVSSMAAAAHAIDVDQHQQRLPVADTHDELEDLSLAFNGLLDRLHESFERQRRFTGDASHQLRTPLTVMLGQLEVALRRDRSADDYRQTLTIVQHQADQLRHIVELLLFLARADTESQRPELQRLDLADWLTTHREHWQPSSRVGDLRLDIASDPPLWIQAHPALLAQVLDNLVENAFAYSPAKSPVQVRAESDATHVSLSITDHGCGIPATDMPNLFRPFYRSEEARRIRPQGTGLGLAVAHRIITVLGGQITAEPNSAQGTTFAIRFPKSPDP